MVREPGGGADLKLERFSKVYGCPASLPRGTRGLPRAARGGEWEVARVALSESPIVAERTER